MMYDCIYLLANLVNYIDFLMLNQQGIPEINPLADDVLFFSYNLAIFNTQQMWLREKYNYYFLFLFFIFFWDGVSLCRPGWSAVAGSQLTASSASWVHAILLPQPPE